MANSYFIHPIPLLRHNFPKPKMTYLLNFGQTVLMANYVWYIEGPKGNILVDTGITPERLISRGYEVDPIQTLDDGLKKLGLATGDIDTVILTHTDHDHTALAHRFTRARFFIQRAELEFVRNPHPFFKAARAQDFQELVSGLRFEVVEGDVKVDEKIELLLTPGHTPGSQSVAVKTDQGTAIITGWCCIQENFEPPPELRERGLSFIPPGVHTDIMEAYKSVERVQSIADVIIPIHEPELVHRTTIP
jgi:glyoxylase-like metal-dependent hydrolase (beta-lactamase superfamily II)